MSCIRNYDGFAKPVNFSFKGGDEFTTATGGCMSIIVSLLLFMYGAQQILFLFIEPEFN